MESRFLTEPGRQVRTRRLRPLLRRTARLVSRAATHIRIGELARPISLQTVPPTAKSSWTACDTAAFVSQGGKDRTLHFVPTFFESQRGSIRTGGFSSRSSHCIGSANFKSWVH